MAYYLQLLENWLPAFRVFHYISFRIVAGAGTAFVFSLITGPWFIRRLESICTSREKRYKEDAPALDKLRSSEKHSTPAMGGILIIAATLFASLLWAIPTNSLVQIALQTMVVMGGIGFLDDYIKAVHGKPHGLRSSYKLILQYAWLLIVYLIMSNLPQTKPYLKQFHVPFLKEALFNDIGIILSFLFMAFVVSGASNAVNLTDGLDGLATGCSSSAAIAFLIISYAAGHSGFADYLLIPFISGAGELAVFCGCLAGATLGFLWFNCYPAKVFMGDTGSLAIGGAIGMVAVLIKHELVLVFVGGVFVMEALSVILQVTSFKLTGKRIFICSPIHHHFELKKNPWSETQVTVRFWIISIICAMIGVLSLKIR
ncbi:MAG: phospho-N-acetylmuramoyl-pentapeptide-transferase [Lentisphaerae bacterium]|nr:phospho-N-acetylmuramoyl-pentapeptide-transferase [Lentisphaerota bacterium]